MLEPLDTIKIQRLSTVEPTSNVVRASLTNSLRYDLARWLVDSRSSFPSVKFRRTSRPVNNKTRISQTVDNSVIK